MASHHTSIACVICHVTKPGGQLARASTASSTATCRTHINLCSTSASLFDLEPRALHRSDSTPYAASLPRSSAGRFGSMAVSAHVRSSRLGRICTCTNVRAASARRWPTMQGEKGEPTAHALVPPPTPMARLVPWDARRQSHGRAFDRVGALKPHRQGRGPK